MRPDEVLQVSIKGMALNKLRSSLTALGIIIGVMAVVALLSIGRGSQQAITSNIVSMGTNLLFISPGASTDEGIAQGLGSALTLTAEDADAIAATITSVAEVAPEVSVQTQVVAGRQNTRTAVVGVTPEYQSVRNYPVAEGEFFSVTDMQTRAPVVVLGSSVASTLFPDSDPVGQEITINGYIQTVIGVLVSKGSTATGSLDDRILTPLTSLQMRFLFQTTTTGEHIVSIINVQAASSGEVDTAVQEITDLLEDRHRIAAGSPNDFTITNQQDVIDALNQTTRVWVIFLGAIAAISLVVGGIGIMNIMLVSVTERTREIGIRKAVGAKNIDILAQFLTEAVLLSFAGGGIGVLAGLAVARFISGINLTGQEIQTVVSADIPIMAVSVSAAVGIIFGLYPAMRAARLKPIDALRYE
jgi:putative ABC transport system permease protein